MTVTLLIIRLSVRKKVKSYHFKILQFFNLIPKTQFLEIVLSGYFYEPREPLKTIDVL